MNQGMNKVMNQANNNKYTTINILLDRLLCPSGKEIMMNQFKMMKQFNPLKYISKCNQQKFTRLDLCQPNHPSSQIEEKTWLVQ